MQLGSSNINNMVQGMGDGSSLENANIAQGVGNIFTGNLGYARDKALSAMNFAEAQRARDWQSEQSNSAYQRSVADMKKAGLNPAMMYGGGTSPAYTGSASVGHSAQASGNSSALGSLMMGVINSAFKALSAPQVIFKSLYKK